MSPYGPPVRALSAPLIDGTEEPLPYERLPPIGAEEGGEGDSELSVAALDALLQLQGLQEGHEPEGRAARDLEGAGPSGLVHVDPVQEALQGPLEYSQDEAAEEEGEREQVPRGHGRQRASASRCTSWASAGGVACGLAAWVGGGSDGSGGDSDDGSSSEAEGGQYRASRSGGGGGSSGSGNGGGAKLWTQARGAGGGKQSAAVAATPTRPAATVRADAATAATSGGASARRSAHILAPIAAVRRAPPPPPPVRTYRVHAAVLAATSEYFRALLRGWVGHGGPEAVAGSGTGAGAGEAAGGGARGRPLRLYVSEDEVEAADQMLRFMYTGGQVRDKGVLRTEHGGLSLSRITPLLTAVHRTLAVPASVLALASSTCMSPP